jgi:uncharacterized protein YgbK (DUF1537 family)
LVVNTESRHLAPAEAFQRVYRVAQQGVQLGIPQFYKKTDSTLRGNVGSELAALLAATNLADLFFAPAYPHLHRTTRNGLQFINDVPLQQSSFATDPFNPVLDASIAGIIAQQTKVTTRPFAAQADDTNVRTIYVIDAESDDDLRTAARLLKDKPLLAGSAGWAEFLAEEMLSSRAPRVPPPLPLALLVVNGSLHEVSLQQVRHAAEQGWNVIEVTSTASTEALNAALAGKQQVILTTSSRNYHPQFAQHVARFVRSMRARFSLLVVFGGDTLAAIAAASGWTAFRPLTELLPGVALVQVCEADAPMLLTKAGGFGPLDFMTRYLPQERGV